MPEACPDLLSCGTVIPIWMNGTHPSVEDGIQQRTACAHYQGNGQDQDDTPRHWVKKVLYAKKCECEAETVTALRHTTVSGFHYQFAVHIEPF